MKIVIKNVLNIGNDESHWFLVNITYIPMANIIKGVCQHTAESDDFVIKNLVTHSL